MYTIIRNAYIYTNSHTFIFACTYIYVHALTHALIRSHKNAYAYIGLLTHTHPATNFVLAI